MPTPDHWPPAEDSPPPRFGTPRDPAAANLLDEYRLAAEGLQILLMPWQEHVISTATELDADGLPKYREALVSTPRQSGKSVLLAVHVLRYLMLPGQQLGFVSANLQTAQNLFRDALWPLMERSGMAAEFGLKLISGALSPRLESRSTGSVVHLFTSSKSSGHGFTLDGAVIDEFWSHQDVRSIAALRPAMSTREHASLWITSTVGVDAVGSPALFERMMSARQRVEDSVQSRSCFFEWSAPDQCSHRDVEVWAATMPALGRTITARTIEADMAEETETGFRRAALNQWQDADADARGVFPPELWSAVCDPDATVVADRPVWVAVDCPPSTSHVAVAMTDGEVVGLIRYDRGHDWVAGYLAEVLDAADVQQVVAAKFGSRVLAQSAVNKAGLQAGLFVPSTTEMGLAAARLDQDVTVGRVRVTESRFVTRAVVAAEQKSLRGETGWVFRHRPASTSVDISPLWAVALCWHAARTALEEPDRGWFKPILLD